MTTHILATAGSNATAAWADRSANVAAGNNDATTADATADGTAVTDTETVGTGKPGRDANTIITATHSVGVTAYFITTTITRGTGTVTTL